MTYDHKPRIRKLLPEPAKRRTPLCYIRVFKIAQAMILDAFDQAAPYKILCCGNQITMLS